MRYMLWDRHGPPAGGGGQREAGVPLPAVTHPGTPERARQDVFRVSALHLLVLLPPSPSSLVTVQDGSRDTCNGNEGRSVYMRVRFPYPIPSSASSPSSTAVAAGTFTAAQAILRGSRHPTPLALSSAVNGGIAGAMFFGASLAVDRLPCL